MASPGRIITSADMQSTESSSVGSAATNFTTNYSVARTALGGKLIFMEIYVNTTNAITATSGNFGDVLCFTVNSQYLPDEPISSVFGNGSTTGEVLLGTDGSVTLRSASDTVAAGSNLRMNFTFLIS